MFSLLCNGNETVTASSLGSIQHFGGPILYLFVYAFVLLAILVWVDSGSILQRNVGKRKQTSSARNEKVDYEKNAMSAEVALNSNSNELLRVLDVTKTFHGNKVVDDVGLVVSRNTVFALLGPNGAGKTTTFNMIREYI